MAIQKIISILVIFYSFLFYGCGGSSSESQTLITGSVDSVLTNLDIENKATENCFESIGLQMADSVFLYWAEVAINKNNLFDHAGNQRFLITEDKKIYYSKNEGAIRSLDNYFNTDLFFFKKLSDDDFLYLKNSMMDWDILNLPSTMSKEGSVYNGGTEVYFYLNLDKKKSCTKFDMGVEEREKIEDLLKRIQE